MFAKPQKTSGNSLLKNKDVKKLRKDLSICFRDAFSDEQLQAAVPNKAIIKKQSFQAPSRMVVYVNEDSREPIAFDATGKGDGLCFSVYALWRAAELLPRLVVHAPVSEFVLRGADVMLPGVVFSSMEEVLALHKGEIRALYARGNPHAFAVGEMLVDGEDIQKNGKKGKGLRVLHYFGDELWKMGPMTAPNDGFPTLNNTGEAVVIKPINPSGAVFEETDEEDVNEDELAGETEGGMPVDISDVTIADGDDLEEKPSVAEAQNDANEEGDDVSITKEEMDALYYQSLLQVLRSGRLKDKQLPILASTFHSTVLLPCRPAGSSLNIKKTSHRKLSSFLKAMAAKGLLGVSEKDGVQSIIAIGPRHPDVTSHTLFKTAEDEKQEEEALAGGGHIRPPPGTYAPDVQEFFGLSQQLKRLLTQDQEIAVHFEDVVRKDGKRYWAAVEVRDLITKYVEVAGLVDPMDKKYVQLNGPLTDAVFSGSNKMPPGGYPNRLARPDLYTILMAKCTKYHRVCLYPGHEPKVQAGAVRKIEILAELSKKHRSSTITTIAYYEPFGIDGAAFAKEVQKKWGCSATLQLSEDKNRGEEIKVQGQMINEIMDYLSSKYKIATAKYCNVTYGKNVKPKKK